VASTEPSAALGLLPQTATFSGRRCRWMTSSHSTPLVEVDGPQPARAITRTSHSLEACFRVHRFLFSGQDWISSRRGAHSGPSKTSHISIARRRRCVEPWSPLRASHVCSLSRASHPPTRLLVVALQMAIDLPPFCSPSPHLRREKSPRAPSRCSTGVHVLAARDGIRPEGAPMGLPRIWCSLIRRDRPSRPLLLQRTSSKRAFLRLLPI